MATALDVANYFIAVADPHEGISNLKLLKLCAFAQGVCLAYLGRPLFMEDLQAWEHGPVVPELYHRYKWHGNGPISPEGISVEHARKPFHGKEKLILEMVNQHYGRYFTAWGLREESHRAFPGDFGSREVISQESITASFLDNILVQTLRNAEITCHQESGKRVSAQDVLHALEC